MATNITGTLWNIRRYIVAAVLAGVTACSTAPQQTKGSTSVEAPRLEHLFTLDLQYQGPIELAPIGEKVGTLVGGGDGHLAGPKLKGRVRWSNYETTGKDDVCSLQVPGLIATDDGAQIRFEGHELAMPLAGGGKQWRVSGVIRFKTDDERYRWMNDILAVTSGNFDYEAGRATWNAYVAK